MYQLAGLLSLGISAKYLVRHHHASAPSTQDLEVTGDFQAEDGTVGGILNGRAVSRCSAIIENKKWTTELKLGE